MQHVLKYPKRVDAPKQKNARENNIDCLKENISLMVVCTSSLWSVEDFYCVESTTQKTMSS
jgi:hypothetical protein